MTREMPTWAMVKQSMPYDEIVKDAIAGKQVVVFCMSGSQAERYKTAIAATARKLDARRVVAPRRDRRVYINNSSVQFVLVNGLDGRGMMADVAYLSPSARMEHELAALMQAEVK